MGYVKIIALDLGKFKTVACVMSCEDRSHGFETISMSPASVHDLVAAHLTPEPSRTLVVMETCDCCGWVHDVCVGLGVSVRVVSANDERWRWRRVKRKTDRDDALKLARLALLDQLTSVHVPAEPQRQKRRLVLHRRSVVSRRTQSRNTIRSIFSQQGLPLARGNKQWTRAGVAQLRAEARSLEACEVQELWRGRLGVELTLMSSADAELKVLDARLDDLADERVKLLQTVKGVGPRVAEAVVLHLHDPHRFGSAAQVASYAGLVPKQLDSGERSRSGRITRRGPTLLRSMLVEAAWMVWRHNAWAQAWVHKISRGSKSRRKIAIVALARKLLTILWSMLKHNQPFRSPPDLRPSALTG